MRRVVTALSAAAVLALTLAPSASAFVGEGRTFTGGSNALEGPAKSVERARAKMVSANANCHQVGKVKTEEIYGGNWKTTLYAECDAPKAKA